MLLADFAREVYFEFSCSGGPGGQHVNRTRSRVAACWLPRQSALLGPAQLARIEEKLATRISNDGILRVCSEEQRSQERNRTAALDNLFALVKSALRVPRLRVATRKSRASVQKRLEEKKITAQKKSLRSGRPGRAGGRGDEL